MNRFALILIALFALAPVSLHAQDTPVPAPTPTNPLEFDDPGMHFIAPDGWLLVGRRVLPLKALSDDLQVVARWVLNQRDKPQSIALSQQFFEGDATGYETRFESDLRGAIDGAIVKGSERINLSNGMPAYFIEVSYGSGFDSRKEYACIWADGTRGVSLAVTARVGELDLATAKKLLSNVSAVRYPANRE